MHLLGFGRVIERHEQEDATASHNLEVKLLEDPSARSSTLSTGRDLSDLSGRLSGSTHVTPESLKPDEAQLICRSVLSEILAETREPRQATAEANASEASASASAPSKPKEPAAGYDLAKVQVASCTHGCVHGQLEWGRSSSSSSSGFGADVGAQVQKVSLSLLPIRPGYTVVGEALEGPEALKKFCWKLQSVNGLLNADPSRIKKGDTILLQGPRWATERICRSGKAQAASAIPQPHANKPVQDSTCASLSSLVVSSTPPAPSTTCMSQQAVLSAKPLSETKVDANLRSLAAQLVEESRSRISEEQHAEWREENQRLLGDLNSDSSNASSRRERPIVPLLNLPRASDTCANDGCGMGWVECRLVPLERQPVQIAARPAPAEQSLGQRTAPGLTAKWCT